MAEKSAPTAPTLPFTWNPGEHVAIVGQTGSGKSTFANTLLDARRFVIILRSKRDRVKYRVDRRVKLAKAIADAKLERIELYPKYEQMRMEFARAYERVYRSGRWTIYADEGFALTRMGLDPFIERSLTQGRSLGISNVIGLQRPARVSRFMLSEPTHVISGALEGRDVKVMKEATTEAYALVCADLARFEFAWYYRPTRAIWRGKVQDLGGETRL
jgi:DNA helicase HerA-like ATPase